MGVDGPRAGANDQLAGVEHGSAGHFVWRADFFPENGRNRCGQSMKVRQRGYGRKGPHAWFVLPENSMPI